MIRVEMPQSTQARLLGAAIAGGEREVCGFIIDTWDLLPMRNVAEGERAFAMDDDELLHVYQVWGRQLLGVYHSHPNGRTSPSDADAMYAPPGLRYWIIADNRVYEWDMSHEPPVLLA